jgi:RNA polymerase sigma factor (sigma-70 family)
MSDALRSTPPTDDHLVVRCRAGEQAAWNELVERYSRYVYAITTRVYRLAEADAEDVFQEVFARAHQHLDQLRDGAALRPWLARTARNLSVDRLRQVNRIEPEELDPGLPDDEDAFARLDLALSVHQAMATLPEHCREILDRFFARDESYAAIAEALDIPAGTIASRISRCLAKLRPLLAAEP